MLLAFFCPNGWARDLQLRFTHQVGEHPLRLDRFDHRDGAGAAFSVTRFDYLLADFALRDGNGEWLETRDWFALISEETGRLTATISDVPEGVFEALRFRIGVPQSVNRADPARWPDGHPLNPAVNNLHWDWRRGYVYLALEGRWRGTNAAPGGFSYHLGGDGIRMTVEVPVRLDTRRHASLELRFDLARLTGDLDIAARSSTHSRAGDDLATRLAFATGGAFAAGKLSSDVFREPGSLLATNRAERVGTPLRLAISQRLPRVELPGDNPLTVEGVALGRALFHDARLSRNGQVSCASCHQRERAFADAAKRFSAGVDGQLGDRNSMPLFNLAWHDAFFWDGRVERLRDQALAPIVHAKEMASSLDDVVRQLGGLKEYRERFREAFGDEQVSPARIGLAIEQFLLTLISQNSRFDRAARGEIPLTAEERRGLELFVTEHDPDRGLRGADCFHCHGGNLFTNHRFADNGLGLDPQDAGRARATGKVSDRGKFKTPSLRNVAVTGPYMHDGRFATLMEVVEHYNSGVKRTPNLDPNLAKHPVAGLGLNEEDRRALVAFLRTLTDMTFVASDPGQ